MKRKLLFVFVVVLGVMTMGCGKLGSADVLKEFTKKVENAGAYHMTGELEILNNEDRYLYDVEVSYKKENYFRVSLKNQTNNHEQIILKNEEGVFVLTPSLNKSFKFQSEWPYNNSQTYILQALLKDMKNDTEANITETEDGYLYTTKVNYSNNRELVKQNIYMNKDLMVTQVDVLNASDLVLMKMKFNNIDFKANFEDSYFSLKENIDTTSIDTTQTTSKIDNIIYPMYIPDNTHLSEQNKVSTENGERVILTFNGESPFMFVQETVSVSKDLVTIPMYGDPYFLADTVAAISDSSVTWISNGMEYYVVSDVLSDEQLITIANSISSLPVIK